jgi:hypothetical protein
MATKPDEFDGLERATQADIDAALGPFIQRFVPVKKRERAVSLFMPLRKRARPRDLIDLIEKPAFIPLDGSARAEAALASINADQAGVYINGRPAALLASFGKALQLGLCSYSDEELFIARGGGCGLVLEDIGACLIIQARRDCETG